MYSNVLIAGFLGLFLGDQFLGILPFSAEIGNYPATLIAVLFGSMFIGTRGRKSTTNGVSIDTLTWHACLVLVSVGLAYLANEGLKIVLPDISFPVYGLALLCGVVIQGVLKLSKLDVNVDKGVITHIGSSATDFLVVFGVASIKISVVMEYWLPIVILCACGFVFVILWFFAISPRFFRKYWFEHGIYIFGMSTGVLATGVILLRITDPEFKTGVFEDFGLAWIILSVMDALIVALSPMFVVSGDGMLFPFVLMAISAACLTVCMALYGKRKVSSTKETEVGHEGCIQRRAIFHLKMGYSHSSLLLYIQSNYPQPLTFI